MANIKTNIPNIIDMVADFAAMSDEEQDAALSVELVVIKNINEAHGDAVQFTGATITEAVDAMKKAIIVAFGECDELFKGIDYEVVIS